MNIPTEMKDNGSVSKPFQVWVYANILTFTTAIFWTGILYRQVQELYADREKSPPAMIVIRLETLGSQLDKVEHRLDRIETKMYESHSSK